MEKGESRSSVKELGRAEGVMAYNVTISSDCETSENTLHLASLVDLFLGRKTPEKVKHRVFGIESK